MYDDGVSGFVQREDETGEDGTCNGVWVVVRSTTGSEKAREREEKDEVKDAQDVTVGGGCQSEEWDDSEV